MVKVLIHGFGKMGQMVAQMCGQDDDIEIVGSVDPVASNSSGPQGVYFPHYKTLQGYRFAPDGKDRSIVPEYKEKFADVVIDFSSSEAVDGLLDFCLETGTRLVLCTTGLSLKQLERVEGLSEEVAVLRSSNMSMGINLILSLVQQAVRTLEPAGFDVEIVEKHHNQKADAPSGTAVMLADAMSGCVEGGYEYVYDRSKVRKKRGRKELGISAVRGGTIVGDHDVIFAGEDEVITFSHRVYSKAVFANGAIQAAKFLAKLDSDIAGLWDMSNVLRSH